MCLLGSCFAFYHFGFYSEFFVKRRLLRPCIALTSVVQAGRGKYQGDSAVSTSEPIQISVGACTFDRVLLYLEHEAREEEFKFDPLIAPELLAAAETLNVLGLQEICQKVLGSFKVRSNVELAVLRSISVEICATAAGRREFATRPFLWKRCFSVMLGATSCPCRPRKEWGREERRCS